MDQVQVIPQPNEYVVDWNKVVTNTNDAVQYSVDTDTNGTYETTTNLSPVFQDLTPPTTTATLSGTLVPNSTTSYYEQTQVTLTATDPTVNTLPGSGVKTIYFTLDTQKPTYIPYTGPITVSGYGTYTLRYYAEDMFGNKETEQTKTLSIVQTPPTNTAKISGYVYEDTNKNGVKDTNEKYVSGWKLELKNIVPQETCNNPQNNNNDDEDEEDRHYYDHEDEDECDEEHHHYKKRTVVTNNQGYYEFDSLPSGTYTLSQKMKKNWIIVTPTVGYYTVTLTNGQQVTNKNFGNKNTKKK